MYKKIDSTQNSLIKQCLVLLEKSRERRKQGLFLVEGQREIQLAIRGGYELQTLLFCEAICSENSTKYTTENTQIIEISLEVYQKLAYRKTTEGILAIVRTKELALNKLRFKNKNPLILIAEAPEKPGNIGAMLRTADAANIDAIILADAKTDIYNPNVIRSSVGCIFTNQLIVASSEQIIRFFKDQNIKTFAATLQNSNSYTEQDYREASAIIVGTEATGLTQIWRDTATKNINIPMQGEIDSMNVSVAAAVLLFEAKRQRKFK